MPPWPPLQVPRFALQRLNPSPCPLLVEIRRGDGTLSSSIELPDPRTAFCEAFNRQHSPEELVAVPATAGRSEHTVTLHAWYLKVYDAEGKLLDVLPDPYETKQEALKCANMECDGKFYTLNDKPIHGDHLIPWGCKFPCRLKTHSTETIPRSPWLAGCRLGAFHARRGGRVTARH